MKPFLCALLLVCFALNSTAQIEAIDRFLRNNPGLKTYYIYQSTLRLLNENGDMDFNMLIKDLRKVNIYVAEKGGKVSQHAYDLLIGRLEDEGFEYLMSARYNGNNTQLMTSTIRKDPYYILAMMSNEGFALMEMDGQINLAYLGVIQNLDLNRLDGLIMGAESDSDKIRTD